MPAGLWLLGLGEGLCSPLQSCAALGTQPGGAPFATRVVTSIASFSNQCMYHVLPSAS